MVNFIVFSEHMFYSYDIRSVFEMFLNELTSVRYVSLQNQFRIKILELKCELKKVSEKLKKYI